VFTYFGQKFVPSNTLQLAHEILRASKVNKLTAEVVYPTLVSILVRALCIISAAIDKATSCHVLWRRGMAEDDDAESPSSGMIGTMLECEPQSGDGGEGSGVSNPLGASGGTFATNGYRCNKACRTGLVKSMNASSIEAFSNIEYVSYSRA